MTHEHKKLRFPLLLSGLFALVVIWGAFVGLMAGLMLFRAVEHAGIAAAIQFDDVPPLQFLKHHYGSLYWWTAGCGLVTVFCWSFWLERSCQLRLLFSQNFKTAWNCRRINALICIISMLVCLISGLIGCDGEVKNDETFGLWKTSAVSFWDWITLGGLVVATWQLLPLMQQAVAKIFSADQLDASSPSALPSPQKLPSSRIIHNGMTYLLGCGVFFFYAWREHRKFWDPSPGSEGGNGGFHYKQFFLEEELYHADLVLYSTSVLFASLAAVCGCLMVSALRWAAGGRQSPFGTVLRLKKDAAKKESVEANSGSRISHAFNTLVPPLREMRWVAFFMAVAWTIVSMVPWQVKIFPEIRAEEDGLIFPAVTLLFTTAALMPLLFVCLMSMIIDFKIAAINRCCAGGLEKDSVTTESSGAAENSGTARTSAASEESLPYYSEIILLSFVLFPIYPLLRFLFALLGMPFRSRQKSRGFGGRVAYGFLLLLGGAVVAGLTWVGNKTDDLFTFDDWRGMMKSAQFPFLQAVFSLLAAYFVYLVGRRCLLMLSARWQLRPGQLRPGQLRPETQQPVTQESEESEPVQQASVAQSKQYGRSRLMGVVRFVVLLMTVANLGLATWPFWGWHGVNHNVFARTIEFNDRHKFELGFLHWVFDYDRDGYSAVLHGADTDDFDSDIHAGGIAPPVDDNPVPISHYEVADFQKKQNFPNVLLLYLEGVTPEAVSCYGHRTVIGTPHIDSVAKEGTIFTQARCHYPSTWDGWFAVCSGRYLRIKEMDAGGGFSNRYSRYNNIDKVLQKAGVRRWCHANYPPFHNMLVPYSLRGNEETDWLPDFDSSRTTEEQDNDIWRGDKRNERILKFIDSLKTGQKFFITEHMSDTHFPWEKTSLKRAKQLGFPNGFDHFSSDAILHDGVKREIYSNYFEVITRVDAQIGEILNKLKQKGLYENTMVIIVGDHGCQWWQHEHTYYVGHLYDQSLRMPMIIRYPGIPGGRKSDQPVMQTDILPTIAELAGVKLVNPSKEFPFTCRSLVPLITGSATDAQKEAYYKRDVILTTHYDKHGVISQFHHKLIFDRPSGTYRLFDLKKDPGETKNLADERPELLAKMMEKFRVLMKKNGSIIGGIKPDDKQQKVREKWLDKLRRFFGG